MLNDHRALLIQDIRELRALLGSAIHMATILQIAGGATPDSAFQWIIRQHVQETHLLYDRRHTDSKYYQIVAGRVNRALAGALPTSLSAGIRVPRLYGDHNDVSVDLHGNDLYIYYR